MTFVERDPLIFHGEERISQEQARIAELERLVGRQALELEVSRKGFEHLGVTAEQKRAVTVALASDYPVATVCRVLGVPRSAHYYRSSEHDDEAVKRAIEGVLGDWPTYGYRRVTHQLRRQGLRVNSKRVRRLMKEMGVAGKVVCCKCRTTNSEHSFPRHPNLVQQLAIERPDQVRVADITYVRLMQAFVFLAVIMDVFTRSVRGWHPGRNLDRELTLMALRSALAQRTPEIHHSDQGVQYAAKDYVRFLKDRGVQISMATVGEPTENGFAERLMRTIKEADVDLSDYEYYHDACRQMDRFLHDVYMLKRIHSSLGYLTPVEFEAQWLAEHREPAGVVWRPPIQCPGSGGQYTSP